MIGTLGLMTIVPGLHDWNEKDYHIGWIVLIESRIYLLYINVS